MVLPGQHLPRLILGVAVRVKSLWHGCFSTKGELVGVEGGDDLSLLDGRKELYNASGVTSEVGRNSAETPSH